MSLRKSSHLIELVKERFKRNKNWLCFFVGETGSGKSYAAMTLAKALDPMFNVNRIVFTVEDFVNLITEGNLKEGDIILYDEAGVDMDSRTWYEFSNKAMRYILQTFRRDNIGVIFTVPDISFVDKTARKLTHVIVETEYINYQKKRVVCRWFEIQNSRRYDKTYYVFPKFYDENGRANIISRVYFGMPPSGLVKQYEEKKKAYTDGLKREIQEGILNKKNLEKLRKKRIQEFIRRLEIDEKEE